MPQILCVSVIEFSPIYAAVRCSPFKSTFIRFVREFASSNCVQCSSIVRLGFCVCFKPTEQI